MYERWVGKPRPKQYGLNFVGVASGYISGHLGTITIQLYAASIEEARRMFDSALENSRVVNLSNYHVARKDA